MNRSINLAAFCMGCVSLGFSAGFAAGSGKPDGLVFFTMIAGALFCVIGGINLAGDDKP